jgi:hypothetical protein
MDVVPGGIAAQLGVPQVKLPFDHVGFRVAAAATEDVTIGTTAARAPVTRTAAMPILPIR